MLYNVTFRLNDESEYLVPKVPYTAAPDEDRVTKRICFADTIEHCLQAIGHRDLYEGCYIVVRSVDENGLDPFKLVTPEELFDTGKVPDALENNEYWYLDEVAVNREIYMVEHFDYEHGIAFTCIRKDDMAALVEKYVPDRPFKRNEGMEQAYDRVVGYLQGNGMYEESDSFEDEVAELPWAQMVRISNLQMRRMDMEKREEWYG